MKSNNNYIFSFYVAILSENFTLLLIEVPDQYIKFQYDYIFLYGTHIAFCLNGKC